MWVVNDRLQNRGHLCRGKKTLALDDFAAARVEDHRGRPAIILVAAGQVGMRILIDADGDVAGLNQRDDAGITVGLYIHHMAPVTPDRLQIEQHEFVLALRFRKSRVAPRLPLDGFFG